MTKWCIERQSGRVTGNIWIFDQVTGWNVYKCATTCQLLALLMTAEPLSGHILAYLIFSDFLSPAEFLADNSHNFRGEPSWSSRPGYASTCWHYLVSISRVGSRSIFSWNYTSTLFKFLFGSFEKKTFVSPAILALSTRILYYTSYMKSAAFRVWQLCFGPNFCLLFDAQPPHWTNVLAISNIPMSCLTDVNCWVIQDSFYHVQEICYCPNKDSKQSNLSLNASLNFSSASAPHCLSICLLNI